MLMGNFTGSVGVGRTVQNGGELMIAIAVLSLQGLPGGGLERIRQRLRLIGRPGQQVALIVEHAHVVGGAIATLPNCRICSTSEI
jgi:hypothetical protein